MADNWLLEYLKQAQAAEQPQQPAAQQWSPPLQVEPPPGHQAVTRPLPMAAPTPERTTRPSGDEYRRAANAAYGRMDVSNPEDRVLYHRDAMEYLGQARRADKELLDRRDQLLARRLELRQAKAEKASPEEDLSTKRAQLLKEIDERNKVLAELDARMGAVKKSSKPKR